MLYYTGVQTRSGIDGAIFARLPTNHDLDFLPDLQLTFIANAFEGENIKCAIQRMNHLVYIYLYLHLKICNTVVLSM